MFLTCSSYSMFLNTYICMVNCPADLSATDWVERTSNLGVLVKRLVKANE